MPIWEAILLGIVQGLTEFLPISSTAHLIVIRQLLGHARAEDAFTVVIQLGTLGAVVAYFRADIVRMVNGLRADFRCRCLGSTPDSRLGWLVVLGSVPAVVVGATLKGWLKRSFFNVPSVAVVSIIFALLMLAAEWWARRRAARGRPPKGVAEIGWKESLWIGLWQAFALMPGGSRSGTTITGGLFAGLSRPVAARFSFLLALPVMLGAGLKELYDEYRKLQTPVAGEPPSLFASAEQVTALLVGTLVSAGMGYLAMAFLIRFLRRYSTVVFVAYRLLLGGTILVLLATQVIA